MSKPSPTTLQELLATLDEDGASTPLIFTDRDGVVVHALGQLKERAERLAGGLAAAGIGPRDAIAVQLPNCPDSVVVQFAAAMLDAVFVPIVPVYGPADVTRILDDAAPRAFFSQDRWRKFDYAEGWRSIPTHLRPGVVAFRSQGPSGSGAWDALEEAEPLSAWPQAESSTSVIIYTSGSTGVPKGVRHGARGLVAEARNTDYRPRGDGSDCYLQSSAAGHIGGVMYPVRALVHAMPTVVLDGWDAELAARAVDRERPSAMVCTPFHVTAMLDAADESGLDLSSLDLVVVGGAPPKPDMIRRAEAIGMTPVRSYGMSEHPTITLGRTDESLESRASTDGLIQDGNEVRLVDQSGQVVPRGGRGEIQVRGPEQFLGYTNVPDDEAFTPDGWLRTGDVGELDAQGHLTVVDRIKNVIIRGGENISASEVEDAIVNCLGVTDVAVVGVPDERYGERVCAFVVLEEGHDLSLEDLMQHFLAAGIAKQKVPERLHILSALPRTGTGKVRKPELLALIASKRIDTKEEAAHR